MKNKECYVVMVSSGEWEENVKFNTGTVFLSLLSAEKAKKETEEYYTTRTPFPFDYCTEQEFVKLLYRGKVLEEEELIYDEWVGKKYEQGEFRCCWVEKLNLKD